MKKDLALLWCLSWPACGDRCVQLLVQRQRREGRRAGTGGARDGGGSGGSSGAFPRGEPEVPGAPAAAAGGRASRSRWRLCQCRGALHYERQLLRFWSRGQRLRDTGDPTLGTTCLDMSAWQPCECETAAVQRSKAAAAHVVHKSSALAEMVAELRPGLDPCTAKRRLLRFCVRPKRLCRHRTRWHRHGLFDRLRRQHGLRGAVAARLSTAAPPRLCTGFGVPGAESSVFEMSSSSSRAKIAAVSVAIFGAASAVFLLRQDPPASAPSKPTAEQPEPLALLAASPAGAPPLPRQLDNNRRAPHKRRRCGRRTCGQRRRRERYRSTSPIAAELTLVSVTDGTATVQTGEAEPEQVRVGDLLESGEVTFVGKHPQSWRTQSCCWKTEPRSRAARSARSRSRRSRESDRAARGISPHAPAPAGDPHRVERLALKLPAGANAARADFGSAARQR